MCFSVRFAVVWHNYHIKNINSLQTGDPEPFTISKAEYEKRQAQSKRVSEPEDHVEMLAILNRFVVTISHEE